MTKERLHRRFPDASAHHFGCQPMPEGERRHFALDTESLAKLGHDMLDRPRADRPSRLPRIIPAAKGWEHPGAAWLVAALLPVCRKELSSFTVKEDSAAFSAFCPINIGDAVLNGNVTTA